MDYPVVLRAMMSAGGLNQAKLGRRLRVKQPTVSRWLAGAKPKVDQHDRIVVEARRLGVLDGAAEAGPPAAENSPGGFREDQAPLRTVRLVGYVGAAAEAHFYAVSEDDLDEVAAPEGSTPSTVAVEIRGTSLGALFDRWLVFYDDVRRPVTPDLIGRLCVVGLADERVLIKKIKRGKDGLFTLLSNTEEPIHNAVIEWAARVKTMVPR